MFTYEFGGFVREPFTRVVLGSSILFLVYTRSCKEEASAKLTQGFISSLSLFRSVEVRPVVNIDSSVLNFTETEKS